MKAYTMNPTSTYGARIYVPRAHLSPAVDTLMRQWSLWGGPDVETARCLSWEFSAHDDGPKKFRAAVAALEALGFTVEPICEANEDEVFG